MKRKIVFFLLMLVSFIGFGFSSGSSNESPCPKNQTLNPVTKYEEYPNSNRSQEELFHEYHLIITSSLEEAENTFKENHAWALRMLKNADNYLGLLIELLKGDTKNKFSGLNAELKKIISCLEHKNTTNLKESELLKKISGINCVLRKELGPLQAKQ